MAEAHTDEYLARKLSRAEYWKLSEDEWKERNLAQKRISNRKKRQNKEYVEMEKESNRKYKQTPEGKKSLTLSNWTNTLGLEETREEMDRIYILRETQEFCSSCGCKLTRDGSKCSSDASMDHCHTTNRFRQICCKSCNNFDNWKKFWVDGIFGGTKVPRGPP